MKEPPTTTLKTQLKALEADKVEMTSLLRSLNYWLIFYAASVLLLGGEACADNPAANPIINEDNGAKLLYAVSPSVEAHAKHMAFARNWFLNHAGDGEGVGADTFYEVSALFPIMKTDRAYVVDTLANTVSCYQAERGKVRLVYKANLPNSWENHKPIS
jgi:hypothetical protein